MPEYEDPYQQAADGLDNEDLGLTPNVIRASKVKRERVHWMWPARLPRGKLVILDGDPDVGKSTVCIDTAARVTTGSPLADGYQPPHPENVLILRAEDGMADTILPRLLAAGGDPERFMELAGIPEIDDVGRLSYRPPELPTDCRDLEDVIRQYEIALVIVDPLVAFLADYINANRDQAVRRALAPMAALAERTGATLLAIRHLNKSTASPTLYRGGGSIGLLAAARLVLVAGHDPQNKGRKLLGILKSNLAVKADTLAYRLIPNDEYECGQIQWEGTSELTAADILQMLEPDPDERSKMDEAVHFLFTVLENGPLLVNDIERQAKQAGISWDCCQKAKRLAGVESFRELDARGRWLWRLPNMEDLFGDDHAP
jgi:hypothetical protein